MRVWEQGEVLNRSQNCVTYTYTEKGCKLTLSCKQVSKLLHSKKATNNLLKECTLLSKLHHPNILGFDHKFEDESHWHMLFEAYPSGDLQ